MNKKFEQFIQLSILIDTIILISVSAIAETISLTSKMNLSQFIVGLLMGWIVGTMTKGMIIILSMNETWRRNRFHE